MDFSEFGSLVGADGLFSVDLFYPVAAAFLGGFGFGGFSAEIEQQHRSATTAPYSPCSTAAIRDCSVFSFKCWDPF